MLSDDWALIDFHSINYSISIEKTEYGVWFPLAYFFYSKRHQKVIVAFSKHKKNEWKATKTLMCGTAPRIFRLIHFFFMKFIFKNYFFIVDNSKPIMVKSPTGKLVVGASQTDANKNSHAAIFKKIID